MSLLCNSGKPLTTFTYSHWYCVFCATVPKHQNVSDIPIVVPSVQLWQTILHFQLFPLILCLLCNLDKPSCTFIYSHWYCAVCTLFCYCNHFGCTCLLLCRNKCLMVVNPLETKLYFLIFPMHWSWRRLSSEKGLLLSQRVWCRYFSTNSAPKYHFPHDCVTKFFIYSSSSKNLEGVQNYDWNFKSAEKRIMM